MSGPRVWFRAMGSSDSQLESDQRETEPMCAAEMVRWKREERRSRIESIV